MKKIWVVLLFILGCELVGLAGTPVNLSAIPTWYADLNKPSFNPPPWIFAPVWTTLYAMMGISAYLVWAKGTKQKKVRSALKLFVIQLTFNFLWTFLFFGLHSPILGVIDLGALLCTLILTILAFRKISLPAAYLLIPYLAWASFASVLNIAIVVLNK